MLKALPLHQWPKVNQAKRWLILALEMNETAML